MKSDKKLTERHLQEILVNVYNKGQETENISVLELIEDIKQQFLSYSTK
ncbi:hypothetical protein [Metabacillus halosaccharovorans]|uniref:Fur-regulated basic protein FbpA n=1 Tax=Metabacillus halosaccharovorans TaxID=930124 RepID=A0ABT3DCN1_9BACI|nr:hypothetical protein [Metabacillus halosaccharovorans]MCV9884809.1 hypothetical protein [Metabacillus halosaccharovorans]